MSLTMIRPPYEFTGAYSGCYAEPRVAVDKRHVYMLREVLAFGFFDALEIGSYRGASSTAFAEAVNAEQVDRVTFCDRRPLPELIRVASVCSNQKVGILMADSLFALTDTNADFIFVDGSHDLATVTQEVELLKHIRPTCIMAHDTNATDAGYVHAEGAKYLKEQFSGGGYFTLEDAVQRDGEETHRGLFFSTTDKELYEHAKAVFAKWGDA